MIRLLEIGVNLSIGNAIKTRRREEIRLYFRKQAEKALHYHRIFLPSLHFIGYLVATASCRCALRACIIQD